MRALSLRRAGGLVLDDVPESLHEDGESLVEALAVGVCGTDPEDRAEPGWADGLLTDHVRWEAWPRTFESDATGIKSVIRIGS